jgi:hypothetical protein
MNMLSLQDIADRLEGAEQSVLEATRIEALHASTSKDQDRAAYEDIVAYCEQIERHAQRVRNIAEKRLRKLDTEPAPESVMVAFIAKRIEPKEPTMKKDVDLAGGAKSGALRRADGRCELCGAEWRLSVHHIVKRSDGGLDMPENLIVLCQTCHNEVEDYAYNSREEVLRHKVSRDALTEPKRGNGKQPELSPSEKAAITRQENALREAQIDREVSEWGEPWDALFAKCVVYVPVGVEPPPDPDWYVIVYGAGRHAAAHGKRS